MTWARVGVVSALTVVALVLQVSIFPEVTAAFAGAVAPNFCLLLVVAAALARGARFAMPLGFGAGLLLDLAPPADHSAGQWALALVVVGYLTSQIRPDVRPRLGSMVALAAAMSFVGTSVFALTGLILGEIDTSFAVLLKTIGLAVLWDVILAPLVLPLVLNLLGRLEPARATA